MHSDSDSEQELFPIEFGSSFSAFSYNDPLSVTGVLGAVVQEDIANVKRLIAKGLSPNINDNLGNTPIHHAVLTGNEDIVEYLLTLEELEVNARNFEGETALHKAVEKGHLSIVTRLIKANCDLNLSNNEGIAPIHGSVRDPRILQLLLESGANPDVVDCTGDSALHLAVNANCLDAVHMLLYFNADANVPCANGVTPFMRAIYMERSSIQEVLLDYVSDFNAATEEHLTTLALALTQDCPLLKEIIERGADVNYESIYFNAFLLCCQNPDRVKFELIWKHFKHQELFPRQSYLDHLVWKLPPDELCAYLTIILASGNLKPLFVDFEIPEELCHLLNSEGEARSKWWSITSQLICLYLSDGYALPASTISRLYTYTGYSELLWICFHMDISPGPILPSVTSILCHPSVTMDCFYYMLVDWIAGRRVQERHCRGLFRLGSIRKNVEFEANRFNRALFTGVPSLKELGRNATRDYLVRKFKLDTCKDYHFFIKYLLIPTICKNILLFKSPLYM